MSQSSRASLGSQPNSMSELCELGNLTSSSNTTDGSDSSPQPAQKRGWVNECFDTIEIDGILYRVCKAEGCLQRYKAGSSHLVFRKHWKQEHGLGLGLQSKRTIFMFHNEFHTNRFIKCVVALHLKYSMVDAPEFKDFVQSLNPQKTLVSRKTLSLLIRSSRIQLADQICSKLTDAVSVALTFDIWSPRKGARGFGCVTAHYISNRGLENIILHFERMMFPHTASVIREFIEKPIKMFQLEGRIAAITTDNASNNTAAIRDMNHMIGLASLNLGFIHYKCVAHIIDLGMRQCLKSLKETIRPARDAVMAVLSSEKRIESFESRQDELIREGAQLTRQPMQLIEDVDHRWNSSFNLLERAYLLRDAIDQMLDTEEGLESMDPINWGEIQKIIKFLKPFSDATKRLCSGTDVTISVVGYTVPRLIEHCDFYEKSLEKWIREAALSFHSKLTDYQLELYHPIVDLAYFLDPRYKTLGASQEHRNSVIDRVRTVLENTTNETQERTRSQETSIVGYDSDTENSTDEIELYCNERREFLKTDVLAWWRLNAARFPKLAMLALKVLPIQATSVASERVFSVAGDVDTKSRNRLADESVESIVLLKSWMKFLHFE